MQYTSSHGPACPRHTRIPLTLKSNLISKYSSLSPHIHIPRGIPSSPLLNYIKPHVLHTTAERWIATAYTLMTKYIDDGITNGRPQTTLYFCLQELYTKRFNTCTETRHRNPFYYHAVTTSTVLKWGCPPTLLSCAASSGYRYAPCAPSKHNCQIQPDRLCSQQNTIKMKKNGRWCGVVHDQLYSTFSACDNDLGTPCFV